MSKRVLKILLISCVILSMIITSVYAVPGNNKAKDKFRYEYTYQNRNRNYFSDLAGYEWAERCINMMYRKNMIKGVGNGKFSPASASREIETIILCLRLMGWEDDLIEDASLPLKYKGKKPDSWMVPCITMAYEKGLLTEDELKTFNPNKASTRSRTAVYIVRTLGLENEALKHMDERLDFDDFESIPEEHIGYVYVVNNLGLMVGYNDNFYPNKPINRAELAVLISRVDDIVDTDISYSVEGEIVELSDDEITIDIDGEEKDFDLSDDLSVYINDEEVYLDDLEIGMTVTLEIKDDLVINIEVTEDNDDSPKVFVRYSGVLEDITRDDDEITSIDITIGNSRTSDEFELAENAIISIEGNDNELEDKYIGCEVVIVVGSDDKIYKIKVYLEKIEGTLTGILEEDNEIIGVEVSTNDSSTSESFNFTDDTKICVDGEREELQDEYIGCDVKLLLYGDGTVSNLDILEDTNEPYYIEGEIVEISDDEITLSIDGENEEYDLLDNLLVLIDGEEEDLEDLEIGMIVELKVRNDLVIRIKVIEDDEIVFVKYRGVLEDINRDEDEITSVDVTIGSSTSLETFELYEDVEIKVKDENVELEDKYIGCDLKVVIGSDDLIYKMNISLQEIEGTLTGLIEEDEEIIGIKITTEDSTDMETFYLSDDIEIYVNGEEEDLEDEFIGYDIKLTLFGDNTVYKIEINYI